MTNGRFIAVVLLLAASNLIAQERPVRWRVVAPAPNAAVPRGTVVGVTIAAAIESGWKLYSLQPQQGGPIATSIAIGDSAFTIDSIVAPPATEYPDRNFNIFTFIYEDSVKLRALIRADPRLSPGRRTLTLLVSYQTCTRTYCLPPRTDTLAVDLKVAVASIGGETPSAERQTPSPSLAQTAALAAPAAPAAPATPAAPPTPLMLRAPTDLASFARFVWLALTMGLLSLLTPCVLPMIPITIAYFGGADPANKRDRGRAALAHAAGIVVAFALIGLLVAGMLGAGGVLRLAANPVLNVAIAALFVAFALNLAGVFEITLPQRLLAAASSAGTGRRHAAGAVLMGAAFAVTSFTCTVPFVGTLLVLATQGSWRWPLVGLTAYGAAFALPFFALAFAPAALERLPRGGSWMITLKRSVAIAEIALAIKFLSNADLVLGTNYLTREVVIASWTLSAAGIAVLWLIHAVAAFRVAGRVAVAAVSTVAVTLALTIWLARGLTGANLGEMEAYLPPKPELAWIMNDYEGALRQARDSQRPVLLDFTGYTCTNCRWMEANMFPRPEIASRMERFVRVRLYTDGIGEPYLTQQRLQLDRFGTVALPYYAVVNPDGAPLATFLGMTRDVDEFSRFLAVGVPGSP